MSKFNTPTRARTAAVGPIKTKAKTAQTAEGGAGHLRDARSELFLLAVTNMVGESTFYETGNARDSRYIKLVRKLAIKDPEWVAGMLAWLRGPDANMRSAALVAAAEYVHARLEAGLHGDNRHVVSSVLQRADEPGEMLAYWITNFGRPIPKPIKRGIGDAATRLYSERSLLKYDTSSHGFRFGDVIDLTHPIPKGAWQSDLFQHAIDRRHNRGEDIPDSLNTLAKNRNVRGWTPVEITARATYTGGELTPLSEVLAQSGMTWEDVPSLVNGPWTKELWEAIIPSMGYMALLRNLRNFDQAGVSDEVADLVAAKLMDADEVSRSRQFPFRLFAAYKNTGSLRWGNALERAVKHSLANVPAPPGRTLVLVDQSPSMFPGPYYSGAASKSDISYADKAALFGTAIALRANHADLVGYGFDSYKVPFTKGDSVLRTMKKFREENGTDTLGVLQKHFDGHDRVIIVTDEQTTFTDVGSRRRYGLAPLQPMASVIPARAGVFTWNLAGYKVGHGYDNGANWHTFGGLTDAAFRMVPLIESGRNATWPWLDGKAAA